MKKFMDENFLLESETAKQLFHNYAKANQIFDYHNHLSIKDIYENKQFNTITEVWLYHDHYKWRALRALGIDERYITGDAPDYEKFEKWAESIPYLIGNPLHHWTHLELQRYFGIDTVLNKNTSKQIYEQCNQMLNSGKMGVRELLKMMNVHTLCTTDDPIDDLKYHIALKQENFEVNTLPTFRPDNALNIEKDTFADYVKVLGETVGFNIDTAEKLKDALIKRTQYFDQAGCKISDHALAKVLYTDDFTDVEQIFQNGLNKKPLTENQISVFRSYILNNLAKQYSKLNWIMQLHMGTIRNNNSRIYKLLGTDVGCDSILDCNLAEPLSRFLGSLEQDDSLPKTILYSLNPCDNEVLVTMAGNFFEQGKRGKVQLGNSWWFNDQLDGINRQMEAFAQMSVLSVYVGMLTDSRSFLSFPRHEYFRRILCNKLGDLTERGLYPDDMDTLGDIVNKICFDNIYNYFYA